MCIAFWTLTHPEFALILAANRDEFISRPTIPAKWHNFDSEADLDVLSGRDVMAGGTWLGVNKKGDMALLTNITELIGRFASSRGELVSNFLKSTPGDSFNSHIARYTSSVVSEQRIYAGFNLLVLSPKRSPGETVTYEGAIITNSGGGGKIVARPLTETESSCSGLSNSNDCAEPLQDEGQGDWIKVSQGKSLFREIVRRTDWKEDELVESLLDMMSTQNPTPPTSRYSLRTTISVPPVPVEPKTWSNTITPDSVPASKDAAPALISEKKDFYCTRLTTIVLVRRDGSVTFVERDIWQMVEGKTEPVKADKTSQRRFNFKVES